MQGKNVKDLLSNVGGGGAPAAAVAGAPAAGGAAAAEAPKAEEKKEEAKEESDDDMVRLSSSTTSTTLTRPSSGLRSVRLNASMLAAFSPLVFLAPCIFARVVLHTHSAPPLLLHRTHPLYACRPATQNANYSMCLGTC